MTTQTRSLSTLFSHPSRFRVFALTSLLISLAGCGGGGGGSSDDFNPSNPCNVVLTIATAGLSCALGVIAGVAPTTTSAPPTTAPPPSSTPSAFRYQNVPDLEPNDDTSTASVAYFPMRAAPEQRVGFRVDGTINEITDQIDTFSFTSTESRTLRIELCGAGSTCGLGYRLDTAVAFIEVLDQFGSELWTTEADSTAGNLRTITIDAGVLYYVTVVAQNTSSTNTGYILSVMETSDPVDPMTPQVAT
ncbi:MAG: hypothetical protein GWN29_00730, partial [Gammaproteobacteria bacterium]|nr:hypothetical protein [Gammaproteobacteria bacterium]